jgi:ABC-type nitrate/sulfonate/bicarbonate transport system substrate-binding protein
MIPLLSVMEGAGIWKQHAIDVRDYRFSNDPLDAEEQLLDGGIDFIFGNHVSPYMRLAHGEPMVCMAQTENWLHLWVATNPNIPELRMLQGKRVVGKPLFLENGKFCGHGDGNRIILLELQGVDTKRVEFILPEKVGNAVEAVRDGKADACFVDPERAQRAVDAGLKVHRLPPMPMVHSITYTSTLPRVHQDDLADRMMKVLVDATHFFKTRKEESIEILKNPVGTPRPGQIENVVAHYEETASEYETKPYPRAEAILNVHKLACMVYPEAKTVNPLELWDTYTLRRMHQTGYVDNLYGGKERVVADVQRVLNHGQCEDC